jgi:hypothetical protein
VTVDKSTSDTECGGRLADHQLNRQLNEYLAPYGQSIAGLVGDVLRRLHDEVEFHRLCRRVTSRFGPNVLQVVLTGALVRVGRDGYLRPH